LTSNEILHAQISELKSLATNRFNELFKDIQSVLLLDVPDYANPGDSAIFLGLLAYFDENKVKVQSAQSRGTLSHTMVRNADCIVFLGGGSFGGLSPETDELRLFVAGSMRRDAILVQCPQSIVFTSEPTKRQIVETLKRLDNFRIAARDKTSAEILQGCGIKPLLIPDSCHFLSFQSVDRIKPGRITYLVRNDKEATENFPSSLDSLWNTDPFYLRLSQRVRLGGRYSEMVAKYFNPTTEKWRAIAEKRLNRALGIIGDSEVFVTDRLHGMILAASAGKRVVYFDNTNKKVSAYHETWMKGFPNISRADNLESAIALANELQTL
jgi:exopolysaccharide biosynthesis predicted pyruvyltransferase EpsI